MGLHPMRWLRPKPIGPRAHLYYWGSRRLWILGKLAAAARRSERRSTPQPHAQTRTHSQTRASERDLSSTSERTTSKNKHTGTCENTRQQTHTHTRARPRSNLRGMGKPRRFAHSGAKGNLEPGAKKQDIARFGDDKTNRNEDADTTSTSSKPSSEGRGDLR